MKIAVLLTTFNRKQKTLSCLESLAGQQLPHGVELEVFMTDDASKDGTAAAVKESYPATHVFNGTGFLYWAGGMRATWREAIQSDPDYYLLVNDDTLLVENAVSILLYSEEGKLPAICIGSTCDDFTGELSYGGWKVTRPKHWESSRVYSATNYMDCDFGNANIMLVSKDVVGKIGILADHFTHSLADYDYTLRAKAAGFKVEVAPGFLGSCVDDHGRNWKSANTTLKERISYLKSPKGLAYKEYLRFIKDHFPASYASSFVKLWMKTFFPFIWDRLKK
ncbi:MAG TPA: glycosyltransferase [Flavisolibacter sp.]|nr:glycosyltransferase [Flavisolibacter sp.]